MLIQELVRHDSIIASQRLVVEFCNKIGPYPTCVEPHCSLAHLVRKGEQRRRADRMRRRLPPIARSSVMSAVILGTHSKATTSLLCRPSRGCLLFPCRRSSQSSWIQKVLAASTR